MTAKRPMTDRATAKGRAGTAPPKAAKPAPVSAAAAPAPHVAGEATPVVTGPDLKKGDFIDRVVAASGANKQMAKPVIEASLAVLAEIMAEGGSLNAQPLGRLKVVKSKELSNGTVLTLKLRRTQPKAPGALADPDEAS